MKGASRLSDKVRGNRHGTSTGIRNSIIPWRGSQCSSVAPNSHKARGRTPSWPGQIAFRNAWQTVVILELLKMHRDQAM